MTVRQPSSRPRWVLPFLAALIAALAILVGNLSPASAAATAETRVGASSVVAEPLVGPPEHIAAGQRLGEAADRVVLTVATGVAAKGGGALVKYDADFAIGQLTKGGRGTASGLVDLAESQGWKAVQSSGGPLKYFDSNGIERLVIKRGSARTPGSDFPHVAIRNASGRRVDPYGNLVTRKSPGNHTTITWDIP